MRYRPILLFCSFVGAAGPAAHAVAKDGAKDIVAAQVRAQGHPCKSPKSATPDKQASRPHEQTWLLECENETYRVRLVPHMAAKIEVVKSAQDGATATSPNKDQARPKR